MRAADRATIDRWQVPGRVLMEAAGRAAAREIADRYTIASAAIGVTIGTGNNGGDGAVVARDLHARGAHVIAIVAPDDGTADRAANVDWLRQLAATSDRLVVTDALPDTPLDLVVDAVLGIGATGELRGPAADLCRWMGAQRAPVVALDVPSGLDATTGAAADGTPRADLTVAFGAAKTGLRIEDGPAVAGEVVIVEIGIPERELHAAAQTWEGTPGWAGAHLPRRAADAHKYSAGRVLAVVGSAAYTGAAVLSTGAAYRAGAGAVVATVPESARAAVDAAHAEVMVAGQPETADGTLAGEALDAILDRARSADAVLVGCGLGRSDETLSLVRALVAQVEAPLVLDADGLAAFAADADALRQRAAPLICTPHLGELQRLLGAESFDGDRIETARTLAARWDTTLVLKGMPSVVGLPDGRVLIGPPGQPALATAGSGDTLAGTIAGLLAQGAEPAVAALCGLWLGSEAARLWTQTHGGAGLIASDLVSRLPEAAHSLRS